MTSNQKLYDAAAKLRTSLIYDLRNVEKAGINKPGFSFLSLTVGIGALADALDNYLAVRCELINKKTNYVLKQENIEKMAAEECVSEWKHEFRVLKRLAENYESALVVWFFWLRNTRVDIHSALELCDYFGVEKVVSMYKKGIPLTAMDGILINDIDEDTALSLLY